MKFRKRPVIIDAWYLSKQMHIIAFQNFCKINNLPDFKCVYENNENKMFIPTLEGEMVAKCGDWIIKGVNGEYYPCKSEIFEKTYDRVD